MLDPTEVEKLDKVLEGLRLIRDRNPPTIPDKSIIRGMINLLREVLDENTPEESKK